MGNKLWLGASIHSGDREFQVPNDYPLQASSWRVDENGKKYIRVKGVRWFTNLEYEERHEAIPLFRKYNHDDYPKYVNYDAIEVPKVDAIPSDYDGMMGVPISFLRKYCPEQFEIIGATESEGKGFSNGLWNKHNGVTQAVINGIKVYKRLFIRRK